MSAFKDMLIDIQESLERGVMSFQQIADMYGLPRADVELISKEMMNQFNDSAYDDYVEMEDE
jgi:hypothetical protein